MQRKEFDQKTRTTCTLIAQRRRLLSMLLCALLFICGVFSPQSAFAEMSTDTQEASVAEPSTERTDSMASSAPEQPGMSDAPVLVDETELNLWIENYVTTNNLAGPGKDFSVGFTYTATGESWYYNADVFMYSASLYKVPVAMLMAEKEAAGELTQDSIVLGTTLAYLESTALTYSNNDSGHAMVDYLGGTYLGKCSDMTIQYTDLPEDYFVQDFYDNSYYTARYMTQIMNTLYQGGEERFPHVLEYLLPAQPDGYLNISLKGKYELAQKYGSYQEPNGNENNHITAVVFTPNPVIITVMTRNVGDYQMRMAEIGTFLTEYAQELDSRYLNWQQQESLRLEAEALAQSAQADGMQANDLLPEQDTDPISALQESITEESSQTADEQSENSLEEMSSAACHGRLSLWSVILAVLIILALLVIIRILFLRKRGRQNHKDWQRTRTQSSKSNNTASEVEKETHSRAGETRDRRRGKDNGYRPKH